MFEGFIASKFANKLFEKDIYRIVRNHALFGALIMMFPDLGLGTLVFIGVLWHMYSSICNKVGISFSDHFWSLVGIGFFVNIVIALVIDVIFSFLFFLEGFIIYFQFYMSGKLFVESIKKLDFDDDNGDGLQRKLPQVEHPQRIAPISQEPVKRPNTMVYEPTKKKQEITIGRSNSCDIRFSQNDDYASNFHGRIFMNGNQLMYRDTSSNGTVINGKMVHHIAIPINRGDRIMIAGKYPITWSQIDGFLNNSFQQVVPKTNFSSDYRLVEGETRPSSIVRSENTMTDKAQNLIKLKSLLDAGILTPKEFDDQKKIILNS